MLVNGVARLLRLRLEVSFKCSSLESHICYINYLRYINGNGESNKIPESLSLEYRDSSGIKVIFQNFKSLLGTPRFVLPMLIQGVSFILLFSYISASPF